MPGLNFARTAIPAVNQPMPPLTPLPPTQPPPTPVAPAAAQPVAAQPAPAQPVAAEPVAAPVAAAPGKKASTAEIMTIIGQTLGNMAAAAQGKPLPYDYKSLAEAQRKEDKHQLELIKTQAQIAKLPPRERAALLAQMPGLKPGVESLLASGISEEELGRQARGYTDLSEEAQDDLIDIARMDNIPPHQAYEKYKGQLHAKTDASTFAVLSRGSALIEGYANQTTDGKAMMQQIYEHGGVSIEEASQLPFYQPFMGPSILRNKELYSGVIRFPEEAEDELAHERKLELEEAKQGNRMEIAGRRAGQDEQFETLPAEQAEAQGLTGEEPVYQRSRKTGKVTKIGGKAQGQGAEEKRGKEIRSLAKQKMKDELMNAEEATAAATRELDALDRALTAPGEAPAGGPSQEDLEFTAQKHGLTVEEVRRRLGL